MNEKKGIKEKRKELYKEDLDIDAWNILNPGDMWVMDKLIVSKKLGYKCGPVGSDVPMPGMYIIRPIINPLGMGHLSRFEYVETTPQNMHPAEFWCEIFAGRHISVDYEWGVQILAVEGTKHKEKPLQRFTKWEIVNENIEIPECIKDISKKYKFINCEFIGNNLIEVHFRRNPDFRWGNSVMIPKWSDEDAPSCVDGMEYFADPPGYPDGRDGVFIA